MTGIQKLRNVVLFFDYCTESFNDQFSIEQLITIYDVYDKCGWYIYPDEWTQRQVDEALKGIIPRWDDNQKPVYD